MSVKSVVCVLLMFAVSTLCSQDAISNATSVDAESEARAQKKKNKIRIWAIMAMLVVAKVAVAKVVSLLLLWGFFQKFCYIVGLLLNYFMLSKEPPKPAPEPTAAPAPPPHPASPDYNTIGYSYGVPDVPDTAGVISPEATYGVPFNNWPYSRRSINKE